MASWEGVRGVSGEWKVGGGLRVRRDMMEGREAVQVWVWGSWRVGRRPGEVSGFVYETVEANRLGLGPVGSTDEVSSGGRAGESDPLPGRRVRCGTGMPRPG